MDNNKLNQFIQNYWSYYLRLEKEFLSTLKYVEFNKNNYKTYSIEYLSLFLSVCSEIDVIGKVLAHECNNLFKPNDRGNNIQKWWFEVSRKFDLSDTTVNFLKIPKTPWKKFSVVSYKDSKNAQRTKLANNAETPDWWRAYNSVKHNRTSFDETAGIENYSKANLLNVSNAFAALYILEKTYIKLISNGNAVQIDKSKIFE